MTFRRSSSAALITLATLIWGLSCQGAPSKSITLAWDPDPSSAVAGYRLYEGTASQNYTNIIDVGNTTSVTVAGLTPSVTYYFALATYDTNGLQSPLSDEISYTVPAPPAAAAMAPPLRLTTSPARKPLLTGAGAPGYTYDVLATRDFSTWKTIGSVTADATGSLQFTDTNAMSDRCFYRLQPHTVPALAAIHLSATSAKQPLLTGTSPAGYTYDVLAGRDLSTWTVIGSVTADATGSLQFTDTNAISDRCFYRLRQSSP